MDHFLALSNFQLIAFSAVENFLLLFMTLYLSKKHLGKMSFSDKVTIGSTYLGNIIITFLGLWILKTGSIKLRYELSLFELILHLVLLLIALDVVMYLLHRIAHQPVIYKYIHQHHHKQIKTHPAVLFILHPLENLAFGSLLVVACFFFNLNFYALSIYLIVNYLFGIMGHLEREPFINSINHNVFFKIFTSQTFHANHHLHETSNFGFYFKLWDKVLKTYRN